MAHCNELYPSEILGENKNKILQKYAVFTSFLLFNVSESYSVH